MTYIANYAGIILQNMYPVPGIDTVLYLHNIYVSNVQSRFALTRCLLYC